MGAVSSLLVVLILLLPGRGSATVSSGTLVLDDFDDKPAACFPAGWKARGDRARAEQVYRVTREDGEQFLRAESNAESVQIGLPVTFRLEDFPRLSWRWRVTALPTGADEREAATNDSAAGVYVVFEGGFGGLLPRALKYVWSTREPRGTALPSPRYPNARIVVLESGAEHAGVWRTETVDVLQDYRRLFGAEPPAPQGIAVLTDGDDTGARAAADYDEFRALAAGWSDGAAEGLATLDR
jgi:hypothetical protein